MPAQATTPLSKLESGILEGMEALTECPECRVSLYSLGLYREDGRIVVVCPICESSRNFTDAQKPTP